MAESQPQKQPDNGVSLCSLQKPAPRNRAALLRQRDQEGGFAIGAILFLITMIGVGSAVLYSGYSQILRTNIEITRDNAAKNDLLAAARTLSATSALMNGGLNLQPPAELAFASADIAKLPSGYAAAGSVGSPTSVGVVQAAAGTRQLDPWNHYYIYCRWEGLTSPGTDPGIMLISAGPDGVLDTNCGHVTAQHDDRIELLSVAQAVDRANVWQYQTATSGPEVQFGISSNAVRVTNSGDIAANSLTLAGALNAGSLTLNAPLPVAQGGTGASTAGAARANLGAGATGDSVFTAATAAGARGVLGSTTLGDSLFTAASAGAARTSLGATSVGSSVFTAATAGAARTALGATTIGDSVFIAADAATARAALGSTTVGDGVFTAASTAAARTALGVGTTGDALFQAGTASVARATIGAGATGEAVFVSANTTQALTALGLIGGAATLDIGITGTANTATYLADGANILAGTVPINRGGTGASTAATARSALGADNATNLTSGTLSATRLATSGVSAGAYNWGTVDSYGRVTYATNVVPDTLAGVDTSGNGGAATVRGGNSSDNAGGDVNIYGGNGDNLGGSVYINAGYNSSLFPGSVILAQTATAGQRVGIGNFANGETPSDLLHIKGGNVRIEDVAATDRLLRFTTTATKRWELGADSTAESGSNAGSNFVIKNYSDSGTLLGTPFTINRATGDVTINGTITASGFSGSGSGGGGAVSLGASTAATNPARGGEVSTGLFSANSGEVSIASLGSETARFSGLTLNMPSSSGSYQINSLNALALTTSGNPVLGDTAMSRSNQRESVAVGYHALNAANSVSYDVQSVAVGSQALELANPVSNSTYGRYNTAMGYQALQNTRTGYRNTAIGYQALQRTTTNTTTPGNNIAIGYRSMYQGSGSTNIAIGYVAMGSATGSSNIGIGSSALNVNSGTSNVAVGMSSLMSNTSGSNNTAVGNVSLFYNSTGFENTAIGNYAAFNNQAGYRNTIIGAAAAQVSTGGSNKTAVGFESQYCMTADYNTSLGTDALKGNYISGYYSGNYCDVGTGTYNTAVGSSALQNTTSGSRNTGMGSNALFYNFGGEDNTAIGYNTLIYKQFGARNTALGSNTFADGNSSIGNDNTGVGYGVGYGFGDMQGLGNTIMGSKAYSDTTVSYSYQPTGNYNTVLGYQSYYTVGLRDLTGSNNIILGANSGAEIDGSKNIIIGTNLTTPTSGTSNWLNLGGVIFGATATATPQVAIGTAITSLTSGVVFDLGSNTNSMRLPKGTTAQRPTGAQGMFRYNTSTGTGAPEYYDGVTWQGLLSTATGSSSISLGSTATGTNPSRSGEVTTGFFSAATGQVSVASLGTEIGRWDASGLQLMTATGALQINGMNALKLTSTGNPIIGNTAMSTTLAPLSIGIGTDALKSVTAETYGVAVGHQALAASTGVNNTAVGYQALRTNTTGTWNTAMGYQALASVTSGTSNSAFGNSALVNTTTGPANTAMGMSSLYSNTVGGGNTALGFQTLYSNTTGNYNTGIGYQALYYVTGGNNSALGGSALLNTTTGTDNTAVGRSALTANTIGQYNVAVGSSALAAATTATGNVAIGYQAGNAITTGSNNIAIGNAAQVASATGSNQINIGNLLYASTIGAVGVGAATPRSRLHVAATNAMLSIQNTNDGLVGQLIGQSYHGAQFGIYNDTASLYGVIPAGGNKSIFGFDNTGRTGTMTNNFGVPLVFRNLLDDGSGNSSVSGNLMIATTTAVTGISFDMGSRTDSMRLPLGTTAQRPAMAGGAGQGLFRYNTSTGTGTPEYYDGVTWQSLLSTSTGSSSLSLGSTLAAASPARSGEANTGLYTTATGTVQIGGLGSEVARFVGAATQPNYLQFNSAAASAAPTMTAAGTDTNINISLTPKGSGKLNLTTGSYLLAGNNALAAPVSSSLVIGNSGATAMTGANNVAVGYQALNATTTGTDNVAVGKGALASNVSGVGGVAVGTGALGSNTLGGNTAVGNGAMSYNNGYTNVAVGGNALGAGSGNATDNTAVGFAALMYTSTGAANSAVGRNALGANLGGSGNAALGTNALLANTTGNYNVAVGGGALAAATVIDGQTAVGYLALSAATTATGNTAVGFYALQATTTGDNNTAVGYASLPLNTTGASNAALGTGTLYSNTTGYWNTAVGIAAGLNNTTARGMAALGYQAAAFGSGDVDEVTAVGSYALRNVASTGSTALGALAGYADTTGHITALGHYTLNSNTTGDYNLGVGGYALQSTTTGSYNTAVGYNAAHANLSGANNTVLGFNVASTTLTTGSSNILIGTSNAVDTPAAGTSNWLNIGNTIYGDLSNHRIALGSGVTTTTAGVTFDLGSVTDSMRLPLGTTAQRPTGAQGMFRFNTSTGTGTPEYYDGATWQSLLSTSTGSTATLNLGTSAAAANPSRSGEVSTGLFSDATGVVAVSSLGTEALRVTATGSVGIGTSTPADVLVVKGKTSDNTTNSFSAMNSSGTVGFYVRNDGVVVVPVSTYVTGTVASPYYNGSGNNNNVNITLNSKTLSTVASSVDMATGTMTHGSGSFAAVRITPTYNQSGSTAANTDLLINRTQTAVGSGGQYLIDAQVGGSSKFNVSNAGNVNLASGSYQIGGMNALRMPTNDSTSGGSIAIGASSLAGQSGSAANYYNTAIGYQTMANATLTTAATQNTAVGFQSLQGLTSGYSNNALGSQALYTNTTGHLNDAFGGAALLSNTTGSVGAAFGDSALYSNTTGNYNSAFGGFGLYSTTVGSSNTSVGNGTLYSNVAGSESTAVGYFAMQYANNSATPFTTYNTALGAYAMRGSNIAANNTGVENTAVGNNALLNLSTGSFNVAVGKQALAANTTGITNTALGAYALASSTTGSGNTSLGNASLFANTTGSGNTAGGVAALYQNISGSNSTAFGNAALQSSLGYANTALGSSAGNAVSTGARNLLLGSDVASTTLTTGSRNIMIGTSNSIDTPAAGTDDWLNIGNTIYGDLANHRIALGTGLTTTTAGVTFDLGSVTDSMRLPKGTTAQRPTGAQGMFRYNTTTGAGTVEYYDGAAWQTVGTGGGGSVLGSTATGASPSISGDVTSGLFTPAASTVAITTAGVERLRIDASGLQLMTATGALQINGMNALKLTSTGNPIIGNTAMSTTLAPLSVGIGRDALAAVTSETHSVAIGHQALQNTTTGDDNTAVGYQAMYSNVDGAENTALGWAALASNTSGISNTAVGVQALASNLVGSESTAVGGGALIFSTAYRNTALGYYALGDVTSGSNNTAVGNRAGRNSLTTGNNNTILGVEVASTTLATGDSNILIGTSNAVDTPAAGTSDWLNIGNTIYGDLANHRIALGAGVTTTTAGVTFDLGSVTDSMRLPKGTTAQRPTGAQGMFRYNTTTGAGTVEYYDGAAWQTVGTGGGSTSLGSTLAAASPARSGEANTGLYSTATGTVQIGGLGSEVARFVGAATQPNYLQFNSAAASSAPTITAAGTDTNINISLTPKGSGKLNLTTGSYQLAGNNALAAPVSTSLVVGNSGATAMTGANNVAVGYQALNATTTGAQSVAVGSQAGLANTSGSITAVGYQAAVSNSTGYANTAIGNTALYTNTGAARNTAVGDSSLYSTSGNDNTAIGANAGNRITNGAYNTAVGSTALSDGYVTGNNNVAVGFHSLKNSTAGSDNVAIGANSLSANTTGNGNNAVGADALSSTTTGIFNNAFGTAALASGNGSSNSAFGNEALTNNQGDQNAAFGGIALWANTTGQSNSAFGYFALYANTSGLANTAVGGGALNASTTGHYNTAIGANAGGALTGGGSNLILGRDVASTTLATGDSNILIGTSNAVDTPAAGTSNWLNIGNTIYGDLSNHRIALGSGVTTTTAGVTFDLGSVTDSMRLPKGTTAQRPTGALGMLRYNTTTGVNAPEYYNGSSWQAVGSGGSSVLGSTATGASPSISGDVTSGLFTPAASTVAITTAGVEALRVTTSGFVGIGNASPAYKLDIVAPDPDPIANFASSLGANLRIAPEGAGQSIAIEMRNGGGSLGLGIYPSGGCCIYSTIESGGALSYLSDAPYGWNSADDAVHQFIMGTAGLISDSGYQSFMGLYPIINQTNTAGYTSLLINATENTLGSGNNNFIDGQVGSVSKFVVTHNGYISVGSGSLIAGTSLDLGSTTNAMRLPVGTTAQRPTGALGMLRYNTTTGVNAPEYYNGSSWQAVGAGGGSVLGSTATGASPSISGDVTSGLFTPAASTVGITTAGVERLRVDASGNVGIGTDTPNGDSSGTYLHMHNPATGGGVGPEIHLSNGNTGNGGGQGFSMELYGDDFYLGTTQSGRTINFYTQDVPRMTVESNGDVDVWNNLGFGASPTVSLDLSTRTDALALPVGTTAQRPTGALGMLRYNTTTGVNAPEYYNGSSWQAVGSGGGSDLNSLSDAITDYATTYNMFLGSGSGAAISSGVNDVALGYQAGSALTTGGYNTAVGSRALASTTTGGNNSAFGASALEFNLTGSYNNAFGHTALFRLTSGDENNAVGKDALAFVTTGSQNNAFGSHALFIATGDRNTAVGENTGSALTTGYENLMLGQGVGSGTLATGHHNILIGTSGAVDTPAAGTNDWINIGNQFVSNWTTTGSETIGLNRNTTGTAGTTALIVGSGSSNGNGALLTAAGVWTNASDRRIKEDIQPLTAGLDTVMRLKPVAYKMKDTHLPQIGFIAQDVEQILPEVVVRPQDINDPTQHYTMSYGNMVAVTVKAIQELKAENDNLRAEISVLRQQKPAVQKDNQDNTPAWLWLVMGGGIVLLLAVGGVGMMVIRLRRDVRVMQKVA